MSLREKKDFDAGERGNEEGPRCKACIGRLQGEWADAQAQAAQDAVPAK